MDWQTIAGLIARHLMTTAAGWLVAAGLVQSADKANFVQVASGIAVGLIAMFWSWWQKTGQQQVAAELARLKASRAAQKPVAVAPTPPKAAIALLAIGLATALLSPGAAHAQIKRPLPAVTAPPICDPAHLLPGCQQSAASSSNPFENISQDLLNKILADVTYAKALAKASNNTVTMACWSAWVDLVTAQTKQVTDDSGAVLTQPDPHFFTAAERASEFVNQLQPNSPLNIGCGAALNQSKIAVGQMIGAVLSGGALGLFKGVP